MPACILYLLKLSISLTIVWLFYRLLLQRLTFYAWNRWYLLVYSLLSFVMPLININPWVTKQSFGDGKLINYIPVLSGGGAPSAAGVQHSTTLQSVESANPSFYSSGWNILLLVVLSGTGILLIRLALKILSFRRVRREARLMQNTDDGSDDGVRLYHVDEDIIPFSFGKNIYINQHLHTEKEWHEIILHEYVHVRQRHTIDILMAEILCILNWYNPFAWLIRFSIRQNLEFIADNKVLESGSDRKAYQYHLLKVVGSQPYRIANSFNFSSLKKRIVMMNRIKSARIQLVKFLFLFPLMAVLLLAFRDRYEGISDTLKRTFDSSVPGSGKTPETANTGISASRRTDSDLTPDYKKKNTEKRDTIAPGNRDAGSVTPLLQNLKQGASTAKQLDTTGPGGRSSVGDVLSFPQNMLYVLDGKQMPSGWSPKSIHSSSIQSIDVIKGKTATDLFGDRASNGLIWISTTDSASSKHRLRLAYGPENTADPDPDSVVMISADQKVRWVQGYPSKDLVPRTVIGHPGGGKLDTTTKDLTPRTVVGFPGDDQEVTRIVIGHSASELLGGPPIYYVDGVEIDSAQFSKIPVAQVQSVIVYKGEAAIKKFGPKAKYGVISMKLKKPTSALPAQASAVVVNLNVYNHKPITLVVDNGKNAKAAHLLDPVRLDSLKAN